ncbi:MAG: hypothetical protein JW720_15665 [Sedimentisphaerales bacterium]|nr:hypothetical protein [Sedimentisphaerales bacterium]
MPVKPFTPYLRYILIRFAFAAVIVAGIGIVWLLRSGGRIPKLSIEKTGGVIVVYEIDTRGLAEKEKAGLCERMIYGLQKRIDPDHIQNLKWRVYDDTHIEIQVPRATEEILKKEQEYVDACESLQDEGISVFDAISAVEGVKNRGVKDIEALADGSTQKSAVLERFASAFKGYRSYMDIVYDGGSLQKILGNYGELEFRILPTREHPKTNMEAVAACIESLGRDGPTSSPGSMYVWRRIGNIDEWIGSDSADGSGSIFSTDIEHRPVIVEQDDDSYYVLASNEPNEIMSPSRKDAGWLVKEAKTTADEFGRLAVDLTLDQRGAALFDELTGANIGRPLCILLDGSAMSAPVITSRIFGRVLITGRFTRKETERMVRILSAGGMPAHLVEEPVSVTVVGPPVRQ